jgi:YVTN family beta-propeller protein
MKRIGVLVALGAALLFAHGAFAQNAYVQDDDLVWIIDTASDTLVGSITVPVLAGGVSNIVASPDGSKVYVNSYKSISVIATATNKTVANIGAGDTAEVIEGLAITADGKKIFADIVSEAGATGAWVSVMSADNYATLAQIPFPTVNSVGNGISVSPDGSKAYVTGGPVVWVVTPANNSMVPIPGLAFTAGLAVSPDGSKVYIADNGANQISVVDGVTNSVTATIPVGNQPYGLVITPDGSKVYVANSADNTESVVETATNTVVATIPVGQQPNGVAITASGDKVYTTNTTVSVISTATNSVATTINGFGSFSSLGGIAIAAPLVQSAPKSTHTCNGVYSGTFLGDIHVLPWQSCIFLNGGQIKGHVHVEGNLVLNDATVGGDVKIYNTGSFKLGPGAAISGSLSVENTVAGSNSVCGTTVKGDAHFENNGSSLQIGSANPLLCIGNRFGDRVTIEKQQ